MEKIQQQVKLEMKECLRRKGELDALSASLSKAQDELKLVQGRIRGLEKARSALTALRDDVLSEARSYVERIVRQATEVVFGSSSYGAKIKETRHGYDFFIVKDGVELDAMSSVGGGLLDVVSVVLRAAFVLLTGSDRVLVLDEPFKFVSQQFEARIGDLIELLCCEYGFQIIIVTHRPQLIRSDWNVIPF